MDISIQLSKKMTRILKNAGDASMIVASNLKELSTSLLNRSVSSNSFNDSKLMTRSSTKIGDQGNLDESLSIINIDVDSGIKVRVSFLVKLWTNSIFEVFLIFCY